MARAHGRDLLVGGERHGRDAVRPMAVLAAALQDRRDIARERDILRHVRRRRVESPAPGGVMIAAAAPAAHSRAFSFMATTVSGHSPNVNALNCQKTVSVAKRRLEPTGEL